MAIPSDCATNVSAVIQCATTARVATSDGVGSPGEPEPSGEPAAKMDPTCT